MRLAKGIIYNSDRVLIHLGIKRFKQNKHYNYADYHGWVPINWSIANETIFQQKEGKSS